MGKWSNKISRDQLKDGDHIYSWRTCYIYAHHGIYAGDGKVIHFVSSLTSTKFFKQFSSSSAHGSSSQPCSICDDQSHLTGVILSCLDCFLKGFELYRFKYAVSTKHFLARPRGGSCSLVACDSPDEILHRATFLLEKEDGFGGYHLFQNNCEDFAIYCMTGLVVFKDGKPVPRSTQISTVKGLGKASPLLLIGAPVVGVAAYSISRLTSDLKVRKDVRKIPVESFFDEYRSTTFVRKLCF